jgi:hypothetical protein
MNIKNIVKWDLVSKFLLLEIQWCDRNLILMFGLWFIDFLVSTNVACGWCHQFCFLLHACTPTPSLQRRLAILSLKRHIRAPPLGRYEQIHSGSYPNPNNYYPLLTTLPNLIHTIVLDFVHNQSIICTLSPHPIAISLIDNFLLWIKPHAYIHMGRACAPVSSRPG